MKKSHHSYFPLLCILLAAIWFSPHRTVAQSIIPSYTFDLDSTLTTEDRDSLVMSLINDDDPNSPCNYAGATKAQFTIFELLYDIRYKKPIRFSWLTWDEADKLPHVSYSTSLLMGGLSSTAEQQYPSLLKKMHRKLKRRINWDDCSIEEVKATPKFSAASLKMYNLEATILSKGKVVKMTVYDALFANGKCQYFGYIEIK